MEWIIRTRKNFVQKNYEGISFLFIGFDSVADLDLGSRTRCLFDPWSLIWDPEYIFFQIPDPNPLFFRA
jgi:hypothetical protein